MRCPTVQRCAPPSTRQALPGHVVRRPAGPLAAIAALACGVLAGCASYHTLPLSDRPSAPHTLERVTVDPRTMPAPQLAAHRFDPRDGLDIVEVAMLAIANNPELRLARDDLGIARAQAFAAGLLPDPQLSVSSDYPAPAFAGATRAFNYALSVDLMQLVTRASNRRSADATVAKTDLGLLWQEWQVIAQAKTLFLRTRLQQQTLPWLARQLDLTRDRYERTAEAAVRHDTTGDLLAAALTSYQDARKQYEDAARQAEQTRHDLNALLGLAPDVTLQLSGPSDAEPVDPATLERALAELPARRPDLLALKSGYNAQQAKYRAAILSQVPSLNVGFVRARDTSNVYTSGFQISLNLPIFNRNRGNIAIEKATRQRMKDEYQNRVDQTYAEVDRIRADAELLTRSLAAAQAVMPGLERTASDAQRAYDARAITIGQYTDAQTAVLAKRIDVATTQESLAEQRVALQALLGADIPDAFSSDLRMTNTNNNDR